MMRRVAGWALLLLIPAAAAQQGFLLRYQPKLGRSLYTVSWTDLSVTIADVVPGADGTLAVTDSVTTEFSTLQSVTEQVVESRDVGYAVYRTLDSTRARMRPLGGAWTELPDDAEPPAALVVLDDRLRVVEFTPGAGDALALERLRSAIGGFELTLPADPVTPGASWTAELALPYSSPPGLEEEALRALEGAELVFGAPARLDSLAVRGADTLAYLDVHGSFAPVTVTGAPEAAAGKAVVSGALSGRLVWSTGWGAFVAGSSRTVLLVQVDAATPQRGRAGVRVRFDRITRFQVRP